MNAYTTMFGGNLSGWKPPNTKALIGFGQDECVFKQYLFTSKAWTAPDGHKPVIWKDEGLGVMLLAFVSRKIGLVLVHRRRFRILSLGQKFVAFELAWFE